MQNILRAILALLVFLVLFIYLAFWERWDYIIFLLPLWWFLLLQIFSLHQNFTKCILDENEDVFYFILMGKTHSFEWDNIKAIQIIYRGENKKQVYGLIIYTHTDYSFFVKEQHFRGGFPMDYFRFKHMLEPIVVTEIVNGYTILKYLTALTLSSLYGLSCYFDMLKTNTFFTKEQDFYIILLLVSVCISTYYLVEISIGLYQLLKYYFFLNRKRAVINIPPPPKVNLAYAN